jgi:hypothetical protein
MGTWVSFSQLARSSTSRPTACFETLLVETIAAVQHHPAPDPLWHKLRRVVVLDSTFLRLSAALSPWSQHGAAVPGMRAQIALALAGRIPTLVRLSGIETSDHTALAEADLAPWRGWTLLVDLGYYGHRQFARLRTAGVHVITRLHDQAHYTITAQRPVPLGLTPDGDTVLADYRVTLGSPTARRGAVLGDMRVVISRNRTGAVHRFLTDRHDLTATEVVMLYRKRWQIELFFRWLKRQLGAVTPLGHSRRAVWATILLVLIVAVLMLLVEPQRPPSVSRISWADAVGHTLTLAITDG